METMGFFNRLKSKFSKKEEEAKTYKEGMNRTRQSFTEKLNDLVAPLPPSRRGIFRGA